MKNKLSQSFYYFVLLCFCAPFLFAQNGGTIQFEKTEHDFGEIVEGSKPKYTFVFKNIGTAPLTVSRVQPGCGCTASSWTQTPVAVGETGKIEIEFNSAHYSGVFKKNITVNTDGTVPQQMLFISGTAKPRSITNGVTQGSLVFSVESGQMGAVELNKSGKYTFYVQNTGTRPVRLTKGESADARLKITIPTQPIFVNEVAKVEVELNMEGFKAGDPIDVPFALQTNDANVPKKSLRVSGVAVSPWQ